MKNIILFQISIKKPIVFYISIIILLFTFNKGYAQVLAQDRVQMSKDITVNSTECKQFDVQLDITGDSPLTPKDVVLILDRSGSMGEGPIPQPIEFAQNAAIDFVNNFFARENNPGGLNRISIISFNTSATVDIGLSGENQRAAIINAINSDITGGGTNTQDALIEADNLLTASARFECNSSRSIILLSDGVSTIRNVTSGRRDCDPETPNTICQRVAVTAGINAQTTNVNGTIYDQSIFTIGLVGSINGNQQTIALNTLNAIQNAGAFQTENNADLEAIYDMILRQLVPAATPIDQNPLVVESLQEGFTIVPGSINVNKGTITNTSDSISWFVDNLFTETITLNYTIQASPTATCGDQVSGETEITYENPECNSETFNFPNPSICVPCPEITPTISRIDCTNSIDFGTTLNQGDCTSFSDEFLWVFRLNGTQVGTSNSQNGTFNYVGNTPFEGAFTANVTYSGSYGNATCSLADIQESSNSINLPAALVINVESITNVSCLNDNDGAIDISVSGGTGFYTFDWDNNGLQNPDTDSQDLNNLIAGNYTVTVTDTNSGCTTTGTYNVATVVDDIDPSIICPPNVLEQFNASECTIDAININLGTPTTNDNCSVVSVSNNAPNTFPLGETEVTWTVTDGSGNTATCQQIVTVVDNINPTFVSCADPVEVNVDADACSTDLENINLGAPTANDNCVTTTITNNAPNTFPLGETEVTWTVTDGSGNTATCQQMVTVVDNINPTFVSCADPVEVNVDADACSTDLENINLGTPTANDNCVTTTITNNAPNAFPLGETEVTWTVTDGSGNTATCQQIVTVVDNINPTFVESLPMDDAVECDNVPEAAVLTGVDSCGDVDVVFTETKIDGDCASNYILEREWIATDSNGLTTTHIQTINVQDTTAPQPTIAINTDITVSCAEIPEIPEIIFTDNCSEDVNVVFEETNSLDETNPSNYEIIRTWVVNDSCGNEETFTQTISVSLEDLVTNISDRVCIDDGTINLDSFLQNNQTGGNWVVTQGNTTLNANIFNPENVELGTYTFSYTSVRDTCLNTTELSLEIHDDCVVLPCGREDVIISKVITPNGDMHNEFFTVTGVETCGFIIELQIYNRWGAKIYNNSNYQNNWNGFTSNASVGKAGKIPNGTYFYIINLKNSGLKPFARAFHVGTK